MTDQEFIAEAEALHNQLVISFDTVYRVVGAGISDDYYYICEVPNWRIPAERIYISAVGWIHPLKGALSEERYNKLDHDFKLNGSQGTEEFTVSIEEYELPES